MPDTQNNIWIESSFNPASSDEKDVQTELVLAEADVVGGYSIPIIYRVGQHSINEFFNNVIEYIAGITVSDTIHIPIEYFDCENIPTSSGTTTTLIFYSTGATVISGTQSLNTLYQTGFTATPGAFDKVVTFVVGKNYPENYNSYVSIWISTQVSGTSSFITNYTNFSGNLTTSGTPIPFYTLERDYITTYLTGPLQDIGLLPKIVDISFAGWVGFGFNTDIYSTLSGLGLYSSFDVATISGGMFLQNTDICSTAIIISDIGTDVFCSLLDYIVAVFDVDLGTGRIGYELLDVFSSAENSKGINCDVELLSLKITNFSLAEGQYTEAYNSITVDILDDVCPVSVSGTYFKINDVQVSGTLIPVVDGYRLVYGPVDDFESLNGPTTFIVHAENECGKIIEQHFNLTFGYIVGYENSESVGIDYGFGNKVVVRVTVENMASCPKLSSVAYVMESDELKNRDLGVSITGVFYADDYRNMSASIYPQSTAYFYDKEFRVVVYAKDFAGNNMTPFEIVYKIEDKPAN